MVYSREIEGQVLTFGVSGALLKNGLVMYDHQTDSLWSQVTGESISGEFQDVRLQHLAALQTTWKAWTEEHPETVVLNKLGRDMYNRDPYTAYYQDASAGLFGESNIDERVLTKQYVIGLDLNDEQKAYPFKELEKSLIVNDDVGSTPVLVTFSTQEATGAVFSRSINGEPLTFRVGNSSQGDAYFVDEQTGSRWSLLTGEAYQGPLSGQALEQLPSTSLFWFAWSDFYPQTQVFVAE